MLFKLRTTFNVRCDNGKCGSSLVIDIKDFPGGLHYNRLKFEGWTWDTCGSIHNFICPKCQPKCL